MITNPQCIGHDGQGRVDRASRTEKRTIDNVKVVQVVGSTIKVQHRGLGIFAETAGSALVSHPFERNLLVQVEGNRNHMSLVVDRFQDFRPGINQPVEMLVVGVRHRQLDGSIFSDLNPVFGRGQVFGGQPPINRMRGNLLQSHTRRERDVSLEHSTVGFAEELNVAHGPRKVFVTPIKIIHRESLLEDGGVGNRGYTQHRAVDVPHVVATDLVRRICQSARMLIGCAPEQKCGRVNGSRRNNDDVRSKSTSFAADFDFNAGNLPGTVFDKKASDLGINEELHVAGLCGWAHTVQIRIRLAIDEAGKAIAGAATNAGTSLPRVFIQLDRKRDRKGRMSGVGKFVEEFLDSRFMRDGRKRVIGIGGRFGWVGASLAVNFKQFLRLAIVRFKVSVLKRPLWRDAALVLDPFEVALPQTKHGSAVDLGIATDIVTGAGAKFFAVLVPPHLRRVIAFLLEDCRRIPVFLFSAQETPALKNQNAFPTWSETLRHSPAARTRADDDHIVEVVAHVNHGSGPASHLFHYFALISLFLLFLTGVGRAANVEISSVQMTVSNLKNSEAFYVDILQFKQGQETREPGRTIASMQLAEETLLLSAPSVVGNPLPRAMKPNDRLFEHLAIVVSDIDSATKRLRDHGVSIISSGPQTLPLWNFDAGYIRALYFRDPDGHFLELIQFPSDKGEPNWQRKDKLFLGFDHTAIVVRDIMASRHFYRDVLGFTLEGESYNYGREQEMLSGIPGAGVKINSFRGVRGPGIELLQYVEPGTSETIEGDPAPNDIAYWQINIRKGSEVSRSSHDPDGHAFSLSPAGSSFADMREAFSHHWTRYLMEGAELGIFMVVALYLTIALEHPGAPLRRAIKSGLLRRFVLGLGIGLTVMVLIYCPWGRQSGAQFNPAVTLARLSINRIEPWDAFFYIAAQFIGGWLLLVLAGLPLKMLADHEKVKWVVTEPKKMGTAPAFIAEFLISFLILFSLLVVIHFPSLEWWIGVVAGVHLCAFITFEAPFSGMSLNPARSVASALPAQSWKAMWVYFVAPPLAMFLAAQLCRWLIDS